MTLRYVNREHEMAKRFYAITSTFSQETYKRLASESDVIKSIDDTENIDTTSISSADMITTVSQKRNSLLASNSQLDMMAPSTSTKTIGGTSTIASQIDMSNVTNTIISDSTTAPVCNLATFLIQRACRNATLSNYLYWYLYIECETHDTVRKQDEQVKNMYDKVLKIFMRTLMTSTELKTIKTNLEKQQVFIDELVKLVKCVAKESGNRKKKCEKFQQLLGDGDAFRINFSHFDAIPLPLDPEIYIRGIVPTKVSLFKSALMPSK